MQVALGSINLKCGVKLGSSGYMYFLKCYTRVSMFFEERNGGEPWLRQKTDNSVGRHFSSIVKSAMISIDSLKHKTKLVTPYPFLNLSLSLLV